MANLTTQGATAVIDGTAIPATLYMQIHTADPTNAGTNAIAAGMTARVAFTRSAAVAGVASNANVVGWIPYTVNETITHYSCWSTVSGGFCWFVGALDTPVPAVIGDSVFWPVGDFEFEMHHW